MQVNHIMAIPDNRVVDQAYKIMPVMVLTKPAKIDSAWPNPLLGESPYCSPPDPGIPVATFSSIGEMRD